MENIKHETHRQIIIDFYRNHQAKGKPYTVSNFAKMQVGRRQVYHAIERYESGASHQRQGKKGQPRKLTQDQEKKVIKAMEEKNGSLLRATPDCKSPILTPTNQFL